MNKRKSNPAEPYVVLQVGAQRQNDFTVELLVAVKSFCPWARPSGVSGHVSKIPLNTHVVRWRKCDPIVYMYSAAGPRRRRDTAGAREISSLP